MTIDQQRTPQHLAAAVTGIPSTVRPAIHAEDLFQEWLHDHLGLILKVARGCAKSPQDQEDLFQDILVGLWQSIPRFRGDCQPTTWIYRVAFNTALAWQRHETRRSRRHADFLNLNSRSATTNLENQRIQEIVDRLYEAIQRLSTVDASLAIMHLDGLSYQQMSEVLGISENYVGVKLNRIRKQLSEDLKGDSNELR